MKIQVNSDRTIDVDAALTRSVEDDVSRVLDRFAAKLTRVEVHLSDVDNQKTGRPDKRCLIEVRPAGDKPLSASATTTKTEAAVSQALGKMQRSLTTFFGRRGRPAEEVSAPAAPARKPVADKTAPGAKESSIAKKKTAARKTAGKKTAMKKPAKLHPRGPKRKGIYQARRKSQPAK